MVSTVGVQLEIKVPENCSNVYKCYLSIHDRIVEYMPITREVGKLA